MSGKKRWFARWSDHSIDDEWLFVHAHGDYEYRNPTSLYVHRWDTFKTRECALDWLDRCIPKVEQPEWKLYRAVVRIERPAWIQAALKRGGWDEVWREAVSPERGETEERT